MAKKYKATKDVAIGGKALLKMTQAELKALHEDGDTRFIRIEDDKKTGIGSDNGKP